MDDRAAVVEAAAAARVDDVHALLLPVAASAATVPAGLLTDVAAALPPAADRATANPRIRVVTRLLRAGATTAAWLVLQDNAVGVVEETFRASTSSGARRTAWRLPLLTKTEPPLVYAWLPGFRDPRYAAPDAAYDITDLVTMQARLDELWWDGDTLVLAGLAELRHLDTSPVDTVAVALHGARGRCVELAAERLRRPDLIRGTGAELTRGAWAGWCARIDAAAVPRGLWRARLRLTQSGVDRDARLGSRRSAAVPTALVARPRGRRVAARVRDGGLELLTGSPLLARPPSQVLQAVARRAARR